MVNFIIKQIVLLFKNDKSKSNHRLGVAKWVGPNGSFRQSVLEGMSWVQDFNQLACSRLSCSTYQFDGSKYGFVYPDLFLKNKIK